MKALCLLVLPLPLWAGTLGTGLALYLPLDSQVEDAGFHQLDLEREGEPSTSTDAPIGQSLRFDGNGDRLQLMPWTARAMIQDRTHMSVSLWFKAEADGVKERRVLFDDTGARGKQDALSARINWAISPSKLQATCRRDNRLVSIETVFGDTTGWHHLVVLKDGDRLAMYLDGTKVAEVADLGTAPTSSVNAGVGVSFLGRIDDVRVYRRALDHAEIPILGGASALTSAEVWRGHYFGEADNSGQAADDQDADGDGSKNIWERASGTSPTATASVALPTVALVEEEGATYLAIRYRRLAGGTGLPGSEYSKDGLTWRVQTSTELRSGSWMGGTTHLVDVGLTEDNGDGTETATTRRARDLSTDPAAFLRVCVQ